MGADVDHDGSASAFFAYGSEESQVFCLERFLWMSAFVGSVQRLDLSSQSCVVDFHLFAGNDADVSRDFIGISHLYDISSN